MLYLSLNLTVLILNILKTCNAATYCDRDSVLITVLRVIWFSLKHTSWDRPQWFGIDRLLASVRIDIQSWRDRAQWFVIDRLLAGVRAAIQSWWDRAKWFGIDRLPPCVCVNIQSWWDCVHWFSIVRLLASVRIDIQSWWDRAQWFGIDRFLASVHIDIDSWRACVRIDIDSQIRFSCTWIDTVLEKVLRVRHLLHTVVSNYINGIKMTFILKFCLSLRFFQITRLQVINEILF